MEAKTVKMTVRKCQGQCEKKKNANLNVADDLACGPCPTSSDDCVSNLQF